MLLQRLVEYSRRLDLPPSMYAPTRIRWLIQLDVEGNFLGLVQTTGGRRGKDRGKEFLAPHVTRSSGVRAKLLADNAEYVLSIARDASKTERATECHHAFVELVADCARKTAEPAVEAVKRFLSWLDAGGEIDLPADFDSGDVVTFSVGGDLPMQSSGVQRYWAATTCASTEEDGAERDILECLVCGEVKSVERTMPFTFKGIPGGQTSGTALISANADAFESYGLESSLIAPTCRDCAERFTQAANALLRDEAGHLNIGPVAYLFWMREQSPFSIVNLLARPEPEQVKALLEAAWLGRESAVRLDAAPFYAVALSASGARVVVRDWLETTVPEVQRNLARYFVLQRIADSEAPEAPRPYGIYALAGATVRDARADLPTNTPTLLLSFALRGGRLPDGLLAQAIRRNRAEQGVTRPRAALIKLVLLSQLTDVLTEDEMVYLEAENRRPAYLCGRLLAVLESAQKQAVNPRATIVDRFFGTASSAPASVFGTLLRMTQPHLAKLRKERPGAGEALQRRIEEIVYPELTEFPKTLRLQEQGLFSLGYYHQRAADRAQRTARRQAKERRDETDAAAGSTPETTPTGDTE